MPQMPLGGIVLHPGSALYKELLERGKKSIRENELTRLTGNKYGIGTFKNQKIDLKRIRKILRKLKTKDAPIIRWDDGYVTIHPEYNQLPDEPNNPNNSGSSRMRQHGYGFSSGISISSTSKNISKKGRGPGIKMGSIKSQERKVMASQSKGRPRNIRKGGSSNSGRSTAISVRRRTR